MATTLPALISACTVGIAVGTLATYALVPAKSTPSPSIPSPPQSSPQRDLTLRNSNNGTVTRQSAIGTTFKAITVELSAELWLIAQDPSRIPSNVSPTPPVRRSSSHASPTPSQRERQQPDSSTLPLFSSVRQKESNSRLDSTASHRRITKTTISAARKFRG